MNTFVSRFIVLLRAWSLFWLIINQLTMRLLFEHKKVHFDD